MSKITGGEVTYGRTVKTGDYENKRVDVKLTFSVEDGEDFAVTLQAASKEAVERAHQMVGIKSSPAPVKPVETIAPAPGQKEAAAAALNAADKAAAADKTEPKRGPGRPPKVVEKPVEPTKQATASEGEDLGGESFDEDAAEAQVEITDMQLSAAMTRKVAALKPKHDGAAPKLIKELINTFVEPPKKSHDIPQNLRAKFLEKLEALA